MPTSNYSSRGGAQVRLIVLHTAEGARSYQALGNYWPVSNPPVSSHVGIDDTPGVIGEYVKPGYKAWTVSNANPVSVNAEQCAFASWSPAEWNQHPVMLQNAAAWIAEEAARFAIPIQRLTPTEAQTNGRGVCQHVDLGAWGGGHHDCGPNYPMDRVLGMARGAKPSPPQPPAPEWQDCPMVIATTAAGGKWLIWGSWKTQIKNPDWLAKYKAAGAKEVNWSQEMIDRFPVAVAP